MAASSPSKTRSGQRVAEWIAVAALLASALVSLRVSWRKWPDAVADVGHQLYTAWRLADGALLYRDVGCLYGPLSSYFNALLFRLFGPGMMVLVGANLLIYAGIAVLLHRLFRAAYGPVIAAFALAVFVWVFSFNQLLGLPNYTFALPYAHESTHGLLVTLGLVAVAARGLAAPRRVHALALGLLGGLTFVLKPEFMVASVLVAGAALLVRLRTGRTPGRAELLWTAVAWVTPMVLFTAFFWRHLPLGAAFRAANQSWWPVVVDHVHAHAWGSFMGTDAPLQNLLRLVWVTAVVALGVGVTWLGARYADRGVRLAVLLVPLPSALALGYADFLHAAWAVPLALVGILVVRTVGTARAPMAGSPLRLLLAAAAFAVLIRMFLQPRFFHFGFYQAALATLVVLAEVLTLLRRAAGAHAVARLSVHLAAGFVLAAACLGIFLGSARSYAHHTFPVGSGRDRFFTLTPARDPSGSLTQQIATALAQTKPDDTVLVVPEGLMINYLARRRSPLPEWIFIDLTLAGPIEGALVQRLAAAPPLSVVYLKRKLEEHGVAEWGSAGQPGHLIVQFLQQHYRPQRSFAGLPADPTTTGALLLTRAP